MIRRCVCVLPESLPLLVALIPGAHFGPAQIASVHQHRKGFCLTAAHIIHDWTDEQSVQILKNCRKVIPKNGRLFNH